MTICFYHDQDLDGLACGAIFKMKFPDAKLFGWDYTYEHENLITACRGAKHIYFGDITPPIHILEQLVQIAPVTIYDHHWSAFQLILKSNIAAKMDYYYTDSSSACQLMWNRLDMGPENQIIKHIGLYDTWNKEDWDQTLIVQLALEGSYNSVEKIRFAIENATDEFIESLTVRGSAIIQFEKTQFNRIKLYYGILEEQECVLANATVNPGRFFDHIDVELLCMYHFDGDQWRYSLRSRHIDVSEIAAYYGGGGHRNAAGFTSKNLLL